MWVVGGGDQNLILNSSIHAGIRAPVKRGDIKNDVRCGFETITARDLDKLGIAGVVDKIKDRVGDSNVYLSVDIDVLDPAYAPGMSSAREDPRGRPYTLSDVHFVCAC